MQAVIATGGKQYRVAPGQVIRVERLPHPKGASVEFESVLMVDRDGEIVSDRSALARARVLGEVVAQIAAPKVMVVKFKRRKNYRRNVGHRQQQSAVRITSIEV